eukprot:TRINITY_DN5562_c0_g1_i2.p2 TRINITY_DN5562_c0_g1~~TRINITY_DN5562_c0_g1_i2.p2  ORF type:complete len:349 (+),score=54.07 TRINITY_DN5562_c0_g1_i2:214-1260(+)
MLLLLKFFIFSCPLAFAYHCDPTGCPLLCCTTDDKCSSFSSTCVRSSCSNMLCPTGCCVNGRCGSNTECSGIKSTTHLLIWGMLIGICALISLLMCVYYVYEKYLRSRGRIQMPEIENVEEGVIQVYPPQEEKTQNTQNWTKNKLIKVAKSEATTSDMTIEQRDTEFAFGMEANKISVKLTTQQQQNFSNRNQVLEKLKEFSQKLPLKSLEEKQLMIQKKFKINNDNCEEPITENENPLAQLADKTLQRSETNSFPPKEQTEKQSEQVLLENSQPKITNFSFAKNEQEKESRMESLSPLQAEKEAEHEENIKQLAYSKFNDEFEANTEKFQVAFKDLQKGIQNEKQQN